VVASAATALALLEVTVVYLALPEIGADLEATFTEQQWVIDAYALAVAAVLLPIGSLADRVGRRRVFLAGLAAFAAASAACAAAPSALALDLFRALQGAGAAAVLATSLALIAAAYDGPARARAMGVWGAASGAALAAGPVLGGVVLEGTSWEWIFAINVPLAGLIALAALRVDESRDPAAPPPDLLGAALLSSALALLVGALLRGEAEGWGSTPIVAVLAASVALLVVFVLVPRLFRDQSFSATAAVAFLQSVAIYPVLLFMVVDLQAVYGLSPLEAGVRVLPVTLVLAAVAPIAGRLTGRVPHRFLLATGLLVVAAGLLMMRGADPAGEWSDLLPGFLVLGLGIGVLSPSMAAAMMDVLPPDRAGLASGVGNTFRQAGIAAGVAVLGSVFVAAVPAGAEPDGLLRSLDLSPLAAVAFVDGLDAVLLAGALFSVAGALAALAVTGRAVGEG
jgi:EmrB/QacA subfamily drug resistance transporter